MQSIHCAKHVIFPMIVKTNDKIYCQKRRQYSAINRKQRAVKSTRYEWTSWTKGPFEIISQEDSKIVLIKSEDQKFYEQSRTNVKTNRAEHEYARRIIDSSEPMLSSCTSVMMLGCGGGSIAHELVYHFPEVEVTVVDYNSDSISIAKKLIGHPGERIRFIHENAYDYMQKAPSKAFDIIINDIFDIQNGQIPMWTTEDFWLEQVKRCLKSKGSYIQNIIAKTHQEHLNKLNKVFDNITVVSGEVANQGFRNIVYMCVQNIEDDNYEI